MERITSDDMSKPTEKIKKRIRKLWLPIIWCVLILVNITIVPKMLSTNLTSPAWVNQNNENTGPWSEPITVPTVNRDNTMSVPDKINTAPEVSPNPSKNEEKETNAEGETDKEPSNKNTKKRRVRPVPPESHGQGRLFRFFLFIIILSISSWTYGLWVFQSNGNYEYSKTKSENVDELDQVPTVIKGDTKPRRKNGYTELDDISSYEQYDNI